MTEYEIYLTNSLGHQVLRHLQLNYNSNPKEEKLKFINKLIYICFALATTLPYIFYFQYAAEQDFRLLKIVKK